jgi:hypothetical protein
VTLNITLSKDGSLVVLQNFGSPPVGTLLPGPESAPNNCIEVPYPSVIVVCTEREYEVTVDVTAVAPNRGIPWTDTFFIAFDSYPNTSPPTTNPTSSLTGTPTVSPTGTPTVPPTATPTVPPTGTPTGTPTVPPTGTPTVLPIAPTVSPAGTPTVSPTGSPTENCSLNAALTCENPVTGEALLDFNCGCADGVEMNILYFSNLSPGDSVEFCPAASIPISLSCSVIVDGISIDDFTIDFSCDGDTGLVLKDELGDIDGEPVLAFTGYSCDADDDGNVEDHFCFLDVEYTITICDVGAGTEEIASVTSNITLLEDGSLLVLENFGSPPVGLWLSGPENAPNNCIEVPYASVIDVCTETEYVVTVDVAAGAPNTGIPCTGTDTIEFVSETSPPAPKLSPSRDVCSSQPTPVRGCTPTDPGCTPIPCTCDSECEALYS